MKKSRDKSLSRKYILALKNDPFIQVFYNQYLAIKIRLTYSRHVQDMSKCPLSPTAAESPELILRLMNYNSKQEVVNNVWDDEDLRHKGQMMVTVWAFAIILALDDA